ncbi:MAG: GNAT family N-acetyltransferase [Clostridia bacterium]|nr:GNAT family N-acetyltransferase [Clostridia bacterium]
MKIIVRQVTDSEEKAEITKLILGSLTEWFPSSADIETKAMMNMDYPFFAAFAEDEPVGFFSVKVHNEYTADVFTAGVKKLYHRLGIGSTILEACEEYCKGLGFSYIIAKTAEDAAQAFFNKNGYQPLRVFRDLRNEEDKKLFVAKCL